MGPVPTITRAFIFMVACLVAGGALAFLGYRPVGMALGAVGIGWFCLRYVKGWRVARARERARRAAVQP